jgi:hypothetical protein
MRDTFRTHLIFLYLVTLIIPRENYKSLSSSLCIFSQPSFTSILLDQNIFLSTLFSNTLSPCPFLSVRPQSTGAQNTLILSIQLTKQPVQRNSFTKQKHHKHDNNESPKVAT